MRLRVAASMGKHLGGAQNNRYVTLLLVELSTVVAVPVAD